MALTDMHTTSGWSTTAASTSRGADVRPNASVIPYLPPLLEGDSAHYHHHVQLRPIEGASMASVTFDRYAWAAAEHGPEWRMVELDPLTLTSHVPTPFLVTGPLKLNPECPQAWVIREAVSASVAISAVPRRADLPTLRLFPGSTPFAGDSPHTLLLPPGVMLPDIRRITPCRLEVFPLTPMASIAVRFRIYDHGTPVGDTPYLFRSALYSPRAWEIRDGRRVLEEDPNTGELIELVEATPENGELAPVVTVFSGKAIATFSWRVKPGASIFSVAGLVTHEGVEYETPAQGYSRYMA